MKNALLLLVTTVSVMLGACAAESRAPLDTAAAKPAAVEVAKADLDEASALDEIFLDGEAADEAGIAHVCKSDQKCCDEWVDGTCLRCWPKNWACP